MLAVPITAQVPAVVARLPSTSSISDGGHLAGAVFRPEAAAIGAGAEPLAVPARGHHRPGDQPDRRPVRRHRAHQLRRHGLVAAADQHDRVHRLGADHLLGVHRHQVAEHQAGRIEEHFAERDRRKDQRQAAGRQHAALDRVDQLREMPVAVVEAGVAYRRCRSPASPASRANSPSSGRTSAADRARNRGRRNWSGPD